ncbi:MAG: hypothetical protein U0X39_06910 [Bacteroidales bacterium]
MLTVLDWKRKFFSGTYDLYSGENIVGFIRMKAFSFTSTAELNSRRLLFKTKGFWKKLTEIANPDDESVMGKITFNNWKESGTIEYDNVVYDWKWENFWKTRLVIMNQGETLIKYSVSAFKGKIDIMKYDETLILSGMHIINYIRRSRAAAAAAAS